jgi:hypothetical protein
MYCGGATTMACPCCHRGWHEHGHAHDCKYNDKATARLNARAKKAKEP